MGYEVDWKRSSRSLASYEGWFHPDKNRGSTSVAPVVVVVAAAAADVYAYPEKVVDFVVDPDPTRNL